MPIHSDVYTLGTAIPTLIAPLDSMEQEVHVKNETKSSNEYVYIGGTDVAIGSSFYIDPGEELTFKLGPGDQLFAVSDPDALVVGVLRITQD